MGNKSESGTFLKEQKPRIIREQTAKGTFVNQ